MYEKIHELARDKVIEGIVELKDLSNDRNGIRIEIETKKDVQVEVLLNQLYKLTPVQSSFGINNNVLVNNAPMTLPLKELIRYYIDHQIEVIERRTRYDLNEDEKRAHVLEGLKKAIENIDRIIEIIKTHRTDEEILKIFFDEFGIDQIQGEAILSMQLRRLSGLSYEKICAELNDLYIEIADLKDILANHSRVLEIIKNELLIIKEKYGDERRTQIIDGDIDVEDEDLIPEDKIMISLSTNGYIKRIPIDTYKTQNRGGRGIKGMSLNEECKNQAYVLGRLFAELENAQYQANGVSMLKERYLSSAATTPGLVFPSMLQMASYHIAKIKKDDGKPGAGAAIEGRIVALIDMLEGGKPFPARLNNTEQGLFLEGYYQQVQKNFRTAKENKQNNEELA